MTSPVSTSRDSFQRPVWLFSPALDLTAFLGSALLSAGLLAYGWWQGLLDDDVPEWTWVTGVLLVDVAHVYATAFRVYFLPSEMIRRPWLYVLTPVLAVFLGWAIASESEALFWRLLAYLAVFHFVRQQAGWVAWYRHRTNESADSAWLDFAAIYLATIYPLIYWHAHLPREFAWFAADDFLSLPTIIERVLFPIYAGVMATYAVSMVWRWLRRDFRLLGKDLIVLTTAACWYAGIVLWNSDYAFTVTNVLIHGIPYLCLTFHYARRVQAPRWIAGSLWKAAFLFLATVWLLAYVEELGWNRAVWHEHRELFGTGSVPGTSQPLLIALLAAPQMTHYILDGFLWRRRNMSAAYFGSPQRS